MNLPPHITAKPIQNAEVSLTRRFSQDVTLGGDRHLSSAKFQSIPTEVMIHIFSYCEPREAVTISQVSKAWSSVESAFFPGKKQAGLQAVRRENAYNAALKSMAQFIQDTESQKDVLVSYRSQQAVPLLFQSEEQVGRHRPIHLLDICFSLDSQMAILSTNTDFFQVDLFAAYDRIRGQRFAKGQLTSVQVSKGRFGQLFEEEWKFHVEVIRAGQSPAGTFFFRALSNGKYIFSPRDHLEDRVMVIDADLSMGLDPVFLANDALLLFLPRRGAGHAIAMPVIEKAFGCGVKQFELPQPISLLQERRERGASRLMAVEPAVREAYSSIWPSDPKPQMNLTSTMHVGDDRGFRDVVESPDKKWKIQQNHCGFWVKPSEALFLLRRD